jgi:hypothetical protein
VVPLCSYASMVRTIAFGVSGDTQLGRWPSPPISIDPCDRRAWRCGATTKQVRPADRSLIAAITAYEATRIRPAESIAGFHRRLSPYGGSYSHRRGFPRQRQSRTNQTSVAFRNACLCGWESDPPHDHILREEPTIGEGASIRAVCEQASDRWVSHVLWLRHRARLVAGIDADRRARRSA